MIKSLQSVCADFSDVIFPRECAACKIVLNKGEIHLCTTCLYRLPKSFTWHEKDNYVSRLFWGRVNFENAASFLLFQKGNMVQEIMHQFKYKKQKEIGYYLGSAFGHELKCTDFSNIDALIPVPLHYDREKKRGFNQSLLIANGLSASLKIPILNNVLKRTTSNESQTRKHKYDRWVNVEKIFELNNIEAIKNMHIALVDDVLTTGATIESCALELMQGENTKLSVLTLAVAV